MTGDRPTLPDAPIDESVTALVVGAGPAGLAAALTLSRALVPTLVLDPGAGYRNSASPGVGGLLGRDRILPAELRSLGRQEIEGYGYARFEDARVTAIEEGTGLTVTTEEGRRIAARVVLLACGMVDLFPELPGLPAFWGRSVINCPFCHGFELKGLPWGVFCDRPEMTAAAEIYAHWTDDLAFFLQPGQSLEPAREAELAARGFAVERRPVRRLLGEASGLTALELADGSRVARRALLLWPRQRQCDLVQALDLDLDESGAVRVDEGFRTARPGLYAAGDLLYQGHQNVNTALHMGNLAAATMVMDLGKGALGGPGR